MDNLLADDPAEWKRQTAVLAKTDLVWLLAEVLSTRLWKHPEKADVHLFRHPWAIDTVRSIKTAPSDTLTIVSRGHLKTSTLFGLIIQTIIDDTGPEKADPTIGIFALTKDLAEQTVSMVAYELAANSLLQELAPDILYTNPQDESPRWSVKQGIQVRRRLNLRDPTLRAFGLLDSVFTGVRLSHQFYDDCVNEKVTSIQMVKKANRQWALSLNLGMPSTYRGYFGTFYGVGDTYHHMIESGVKLNFSSCFEINRKSSKFNSGGIPTRLVVDRDQPVLYSREFLDRQEERMGKSVFAVQMLGVPSAVEVTDIDPNWLFEYDADPVELAKEMNLLLLVDPASGSLNPNATTSARSAHSFTAMAVIGLGSDNNYYLIDAIRDRLNLAQRLDAFFDLHRMYSPYETRYEHSGMNADIEAIRIRQNHEKYFFLIVPVMPGGIPKIKRCERLVPILRAGRFGVPRKGIWRKLNDTGRTVNLVEVWVEQELSGFPNSIHLDLSDAISRIEEPGLTNVWPKKKTRPDSWRQEFYRKQTPKRGWMAS